MARHGKGPRAQEKSRAFAKHMKQTTNFRLTSECRDLLAQLAKRDGISRSAVIELLVRDKARGTIPTKQESG